MSWIHTSSMHTTKSFRSSSLTTSTGIKTSVESSTTSLHTSSSSSTQSSTASVQSENSGGKVRTPASQKLYLLLPNHKCPNKKTCPFHPPEEEEEELEEAEVTLVNKRRAMSLASHEDHMISEQLLADKLAKINQQISSNLLEGNKLHFPRKTSHDISLPTAELDRLRFDHANSEQFPAASSTREESVTSDYDLDSGVTFDSCSDRELDEDFLPLIQEEVVVPDVVLPAQFKLKNEEKDQEQTILPDAEATITTNELTTENSEDVPESHSEPRFIKELEYFTVTEGSLVSLECAVTGNPKPDFKWFKNSQCVDSNDGYKIQSYDDGTVTLTIEKAEIDDSGSYKCVAENVAGSASTQSKIRVQKVVEDKPVSDDFQRPEDYIVKKQEFLVAPEFTAKLKNKVTQESATVHLTCSVTGIPEPTVKWSKDDREIFNGPDYTVKNNGGLFVLEIACVRQSLAGKYTVQASNSEGTVSCSCILEIEGEDNIENAELDFLRPKFIRKIEDVHVSEGEDATFTCTALGKPVPAFKWQRDMINITASEHVEMESNNQGHAHLTLKKVKASDSGLYYCVAQSKAGRAKCSAYLYVKAKPVSPAIKRDNDDDDDDVVVRTQVRKEASVDRERMLGSPPSLVLLLPDTLDIVVGGRLKLDCSVQGYPMPLVSWHKGDRGLMYSQRHRIVPCGTLHTMEIPQVMALDKGEYIVRATNIYGTVQSSCYVNILPKGSKVEPSVYKREAMVVAVKQNLQAPYFIKHLPNSIDAILGMNIRLDCILREGIELVKWSKSQSPYQDLEQDKKELADEGFHGEFVPLETIHHHKTISHSEERKQSSTSVERSSGQEEKKLESTSFITTPKDLVLKVGSEAVFECSTTGSPDLEAKWYKDGKLLTVSNRVKISTTGNHHKLMITDVCNSDEGEYKCKLNKLSGATACGAILRISGGVPENRPAKTQSSEEENKTSTESRVQEQPRKDEHEIEQKYEKPTFKQALPKTTCAVHGDSVELLCQLTSENVTNVKWELDGRELANDAQYQVSADQTNNQYKLTIYSAAEKNIGKYTCVAYLTDGDLIHTSTKLSVTASQSKPAQKDEDFKPHFTNKLKDTMVKDGEGLVLECDIEGNPRPQISWLRDGLEIFDSLDFQISTIGCQCKLQINEVYPEDEGTYSCRAINNLGEAVSSCYVSVEDQGGNLSADSASTTSSRSYEKTRARRGEPEGDVKKKSKKEQDKPEVPPELVVKPRRQFVDDGGNAKFKASFDGSKSTILFWSKDGQVLKEDDHLKMYEADGFHFLEVQKVSVEDSGMYNVTVQNVAGSDTAEAELEVFEKPKLLTRSGPEWEQTLRDLIVEEGDAGVELVCTCRDLNQPSVKWFHNGKEIFSGFHMKLQHVAQTATLTIKEINNRDAGEFKCIMTGKNGELTTSCILTIKAPEKMEPPVFVKELHDMDVDEGDKLKLDVEVKGTSIIRVSWYHNNVEITHDNQQYMIDSIGHIHNLTLLHATSESSGEYVCEAYNDSGGTETFCFIEVREVKHPEPPDFVTHPTNLSAHEGETVTFSCQVKGQPMPTVLWKKGGVIMVTDRKFKITRMQDFHTLTIYNTDHTDAGEYICYLYNTKGDMSYTCKLQVSGKPQSVHSLSSRLDHSQEMLQSDQYSTDMGQHAHTSKAFRSKRMLLKDSSENAESAVPRSAESTSNEHTIGSATATTVLQTALSRNMDGETRQHKQHYQSNSDVNHNAVCNSIRPVKVTTHINNNSPQMYTDFQSNLSDSINSLQNVPNKIHQQAEDTKDRTNSNLTNFRNVVKHEQKSPFTQSEQFKTLSHGTDFRAVVPQFKTKKQMGDKSVPDSVKTEMVNSEFNNVPLTKTSKRLPSHSGEFTSVSDTTPTLSSPLYSTSHENGSKIHEIVTFRRNQAAANNLEPTVMTEHVNISRDTNVLSSHSLAPSQISSQRWRRGRREHSPSSPSHHSQEISDTKESIVRTSDRLGKDNGSTDETEPRKVLFGNSNFSGSLDTSAAMIANKNDQSSMESKQMTRKHEFKKANVSQLSAHKLSIIEFNPSAPQSEAFQLEVTSVSASVPQRQSLSSPRSRPESQNMTALGQPAADNLYTKQEDDDVFTATSREREFSYLESRQSLKSSNGIKSSTFSKEAVPVDISDIKKDSFCKSYTQDSFNQTNYTTDNQIKNSGIKFSENLPYQDHCHPEDGEFPAISSSDSLAHVSYVSSTVTDNVNDFRSIKLKTAPKTKEKSELARNKFMSKSTESIFIDVKLKPVSKTNESSQMSSDAERIKANSKSSDLSKLFSKPSYQSPSRNFTPRPSGAFKFSNYQKIFNDDTKSNGPLQTSKYQKPFQSNKFRASSSKHEKAIPGGVSRSNSHRKSKGIGAKFEAAIKNFNIPGQVPYTSLHTAKSNQGDTKPLRQQNTTYYKSGKMSEHLQNQESADVVKKTVTAAAKFKLTHNTAVLINDSENYLGKVSDWARKRQSIHTDSSEMFASNENAFKNKARHSTINALRVFEEDKQNMQKTSSDIINNVSAPNDIQDINVNWLDRKSTKNTETRFRASSGANNQQDIPGHESVRIRSPRHSTQAEFSEAGTGIPELEINKDNRFENRDQQSEVYSMDATKLSSRAVETGRTSLQISNIKSHSQSLPRHARLYNSEELGYNTERVPVTLQPAKDDIVRSSEISKPLVKPNIAQAQLSSPLLTTSTIRKVLPPTMVTKSHLVLAAPNVTESVTNITNTGIPVTSAPTTNTNIHMFTASWKMSGAAESELKESEGKSISLTPACISSDSNEKLDATSLPASAECPPRKDSLEPLSGNLPSHVQNTRPSWTKQTSLRHIPFYPVHDNELSPYNEPLKLSMYDSESLLSTASMSSSSSDASNVTADSGYTINHVRSSVANEKMHVTSTALHPQSTENWSRVARTREITEGYRNRITQDSDVGNNFWKYSIGKENGVEVNRHFDHDKNAQRNDNFTTDLFIKSQTRQETVVKPANVFKDSESKIDVNEVVHDTDELKYISRRRQRQLENKFTANSDSALKYEPGETDTERLLNSVSGIITNPVTSDKSSWQKQMSASYENLLVDDSLVRVKNTDLRQVSAMSEVNSDSANDEKTLNIEPRSKFGHEYVKNVKSTDIIKTVRHLENEAEKLNDELKDKDSDANFSMEQKESVSTDRKRFKFRDKMNKINNISDKTAAIPYRSSVGSTSELDINQDSRNSMLQQNIFNLDKTVVSSIVSHQDEVKLSKSGAEVISPVLTTCIPPLSPLSTTTSSSSLTPVLLASSSAVRQQQYCPPSFPIPLHDCSVMYGSKTVLMCHVAGNPRPDVKWLLNQTKIEPSDTVEIIYSDAIAQLTIQETSREHTGDYSCWARNTLGTVSTHCTLSLEDCQSYTQSDNTSFLTQTVIKSDTIKMSVCLTNNTGTDIPTKCILIEGVPDTPLGRPHVYVEDRSSASLSWCGPITIEGSPDIYYIIEAKMSEDNTWNVIIPQCKELRCLIQGLKPSTIYQFRVLAANKHGVSLPSEPSEAVMTSDYSRSISDYDYEEELPFKPREVVINMKDKFEDLYEVEKEVGKGKFGVVYKCKQKSDGTVWAAKVIRCREKEKIGLRHEIDIMNKLRHPKLLLLWDAFESPRQMVLVMEYVGAGELFERVINDDFVLTENDCIHFVQQICEGVTYLHSNNIIHLDLKPENILCVAEKSNRIKIIDFGLAQFYKPGQSTRVLFGTPEFVAPEVINYDEISLETDMWSLGVICYVLLSGLSPFLGDSDAETLANVTKAEFDFDDDAFDDISELAIDFICQLLVKKKENRILTGRCLAHPWLNQDEVDGIPAKPLNTERLKKFMIRRKWLKTGNAVKAVSRLLKSNSLSGFGALDQNNSIDNDLDASSSVSILQRTAEEVTDDEENKNEHHSVENFITSEISENYEHVPEISLGNTFSSLDKNQISPRGQINSSKMDASSKNDSKSTENKEILTNSSEKRNASFLDGIISEEEIKSISIGNTSNEVIIRNSRISESKLTDLVQNEVKTESSPPTPAMSRQLDGSQSSSTSANRSSLQFNNSITTVSNQATCVSSDGVLQAPVFTKSMTRCKTCTGDVARFDVVVTGNPFPHVTWYFEDEEIQPDTRHTLRFNERFNSFSLIIRNIEEDDEGEYACKAVNCQGECTCVADLSVLQL